jgi:cell division protein FtsZ
MDEVEVIQNYLLSHAGDDTDVILGMGYDNTLGNQLGITLIATGFEHKDPFAKPMPKKEEAKPEEKIIMMLERAVEEKIQATIMRPEPEKKEEPVQEAAPVMKAMEKSPDHLAPMLVEEIPVSVAPMFDMSDIKESEPVVLHWELGPPASGKVLSNTTKETDRKIPVGKMSISGANEGLNSLQLSQSEIPTLNKEEASKELIKDSTTLMPAASGGYLARPSNIYAESKAEVFTSMPSAEKPVPSSIVASNEEEELLNLQMQLIERDDIPAADVPLAHQAQPPLSTEVEDPAMLDETEEQKRRAAERLQKLRNLSFNFNTADPNNEFETVPAYIRRNMELHTNNSSVENFYSSYEVKTDQNNQTQISTINTFLDGKKPD